MLTGHQLVVVRHPAGDPENVASSLPGKIGPGPKGVSSVRSSLIASNGEKPGKHALCLESLNVVATFVMHLAKLDVDWPQVVAVSLLGAKGPTGGRGDLPLDRDNKHWGFCELVGCWFFRHGMSHTHRSTIREDGSHINSRVKFVFSMS